MFIRLLLRAVLLSIVLLAAACDRGDDEPSEGGNEITPDTPRSTRTARPTEEPGALSIDVTTHNFGELCLGFCPESIEIELAAEQDDVELLGVTLDSSRDPDAFEVRSVCEAVIDRDENCDVTVTFRPTTLGEHDLSLSIEHSGENSPSVIQVHGVGVCPPGSGPVPAALTDLLHERVGFGSQVTGARDGCTYVVDSDDDRGEGTLRAAVEAGGYWITFKEDMEIELDSNLSVVGNTTIDGRGQTVQLTGAGAHLIGRRSSNVIINDIRMAHSSGDENDLLRVNSGASGFWFHHLNLADSTDEYIDISSARPEGAVGTISWTHFGRGGPQNTDEFAVLIGDQNGPETNEFIKVTLHHNWFDGTRQRHPMVTGAVVHTFNNVIQWRLWGIQARQFGSAEGANVLSENDVFDAMVADPRNVGDGARLFDEGNFLRVSNPLLLNGAGVSESSPDRVFVPAEEYDYELDPVEGVMDIVTNGAGPRTDPAVLNR